MHDGAAFGGNLARVPPGYDETDISSQQGHSGRRDVSSGRERRQKKRESPTLGERHLLRVSDESESVEDKEEADSLNEGADVHWLNSLGGTTCLLVDSYRDLSDGVAIEEAFSLVQLTRCRNSVSFKPGEQSTDRIERVLAGVTSTRGRSRVPPRLLQVDFSRKVSHGDPTACGDLVAFLKTIYAESETMVRDAPALATTKRNGLPNNIQSRRLPTTIRSGMVPTRPSSGLDQDLPNPASSVGGRRTYIDEGEEDSTPAARSEQTGGAPSAKVPSRSNKVRYERRCRVHGNKGKSETTSGKVSLAGSQQGITGNDQRDDGECLLTGSSQVKHCSMGKKKDDIRRHKNGQKVMASEVGSESYGKTARAVRESLAAHALSPRASESVGGIVARQANQNRCGKDEAVIFCGNVDVATSAGQGEMRSNRRRILRWMDHLGLKVDWSLLTPEGARCHENLSNGKLLCELAAAVDYALSGGRGLPLAEMPSQPGRFVLRGTCGEPSNSARSRHNVRTALGAFESLGSVCRMWLRDEQAILDGDYAATWGLLGAVYDGYGRLHPRRKYPKRRAPSLPQKSASVANAVSLHKIAPKGHAREIGNDARPNVRGGGSRDIEAGNHSWRATKISGVAVNVRKNLPRDLAPASSAGKLIPNDYKGKVQKVTASRQTRLQGKSDKNIRVEVPNSAALAKSSPSANGSALGLRACEKNPLSPEEQSCPEQSTMVMQCGTERACPRVIREDSPEQEEEKCFKGWQQKPVENGKKRDSLQIVEDKMLVAEVKTGLISLLPDCQKLSLPGGYQRSYHNSVSHREESSPTTDVLEGETLTSEKTSHRPRWDHSRQDKGRVTSPETYNREETNAPSAGQTYRSAVGDSTSLTTQSRKGHDIVLEEDSQIAPWPPPPPPTSHTLRSVTNMARTKNAIIAPTTVPPAEKEPDGDPGQIDSGIGKASRNQVRCSGRQVAPGAITKESTTCRTISPDDVLPIIPSVSAGLEGTELFLSIGGLPPSELSASLTMPQNPFLRSPGFDLLPL